MIKLTHISVLLCLLTVIGATPIYAQFNDQAVMEVRVEVIPGSRVVSSSEGNIMLAMAGTETNDHLKVGLGRHTLSAPAGMDIYVSCDDFVQTRSGSGDMQIAMELNQQRSGNGDVTLLLNGTVDTRDVEYGLYIGNQLTRVEYD